MPLCCVMSPLLTSSVSNKLESATTEHGLRRSVKSQITYLGTLGTPKCGKPRHSCDIRGPLAKFVDSPYYSKSELCGGAVTVSFSKYISWQAMYFLQRSTHFSKT